MNNSDDQDSLKDKQISRQEFIKLLGAGSLSLGLGVFGISNILKNIREASAITEPASPVLPGIRNNSNTKSNTKSKINKLDIRPFHVNFPEAEFTELRRRISLQEGLSEKRSRISRKACTHDYSETH